MQIGVETSRSVENKRIFVIDEDEIQRAALQFMLHDENETHEFGSLAPAFAKAQEWPPQLVILGEAFLRGRGLDAISVVTDTLANVKVLVVAASPDSAIMADASGAGAHGMLAAPLTVENVRRKVDTLLGRGGAAMIQLAPLAAKAD